MSVVESAREQLLSSGLWSVDPAHSTVEFGVKHMMIQTVHGRFRDFEGTIVAGEDPSVAYELVELNEVHTLSCVAEVLLACLSSGRKLILL